MTDDRGDDAASAWPPPAPSSAQVADAVDDLVLVHPDREHDVRWASDLLTGGEDGDSIDQATVQELLWWVVPHQADDPVAVTEAIALLLGRLGFDRYSTIARSPTTAEVLAAWRVSTSAGRAKAAQAHRRSGLELRAADGFHWGEVFGGDEAEARRAAERALEHELVAGRLRPGTRGADERAIDAIRAALWAPHPDIPGQTWHSMVMTERAARWIDDTRHDGLRARRQRVVRHVLAPTVETPDLTRALAPILWLQQQATPRLRLTATGALPRAVVRGLAERFAPVAPARPPRGEDGFLAARALRLWMCDTYLLELQGRTLVNPWARLTAVVGPERVRADIWDAVVLWLGGREEIEVAITDIAVSVLLDEPTTFDGLTSDVVEALRADGWRAGGEDIGRRDAGDLLRQIVLPWQLMGLVATRPGRSIVELTPVGRAAAIGFLHHHATRPRDAASG